MITRLCFIMCWISSLVFNSMQENEHIKKPTSPRLPSMDPKTMDLLFNITETMSWTNLVVLYDEEGVDLLMDFFRKMESQFSTTRAAFFDVAHWDGKEIELLLTINKNYFPSISIILFGGHRALGLLNVANEIDAKSNRRTDYRHKSKWLVVPTNGLFAFSMLDQRDVILENIAIIACVGSTFGVYTFTFSNKKFVRVSELNKDSLYPNAKYGFNGRHFLIASHVSPQFFLKSTKNGVVEYTGYARTFSDAMAAFLNFTYTFVEPEDDQWGNFQNGTWNGLVGQLLRREVDMAVAELTLTKERETAIDFILPQFFTQGLGMVFRKEDASAKGWLNIMQPLQPMVYYTILATIATLSVIMYFMEKVNPLNRKVIWRTSIEILDLSNRFISIFGCLCLGSDGIRPKTITGRILTFSFWLFCVMTAAIYAGNLTASLSVRHEKGPFTTLEEMVNTEDWKWGVHPATITASILRSSKRADMRKAWDKILEFNKSDPTVLSTRSLEHIEKVVGGKYAYITSDPLLFQLRRKDCLFETVTNVQSTQHVTLALSENSPFKPEIQRFLFHLFDAGVLTIWEQDRYKDNRPRECRHTTPIRKIYLDDIKGAFGALGLGVGAATAFLLAEFMYKFISSRSLKHKLDVTPTN